MSSPHALRRWKSLSESAQSLLMGMLEYDPAKRLTAKQACPQETPGFLMHPWVLFAVQGFPHSLAWKVKRFKERLVH